MDVTRLLAAGIAAVAASSAIPAAGATQRIVGNLGSSTDFLSNKSYWSDSSATVWPNPDDDYLFLAGSRGPDVNTTFNGKTFQVGDSTYAAEIWIKAGNLTFNKLILANGFLDHWSSGNERWIFGPVEVTAPVSNPFRFFCSHDAASGHAFNNAMSAASGCGILASTWNTRERKTHLGYRFRLAGDLSEFYGKIMIDDNVPFTCGNDLSARSCPGTIEMRSGSTLILPYAVSDLTVANISFAADTRMQVAFGHAAAPSAGTLIPTNSFVLPSSGPLTILMNTVLPLDYMDQDAPKYEILQVASRIRQIALSDFALDPSKVDGSEATYGLPRAAHLVLDVDEGSGLQTLSISPRKIVTLRASDNGGQSAFLPNAASHWNGMTDGTPLSDEVDYFVTTGYIRTPEGANADTVFHGASLTFKNGSTLVLKNSKDVVIGDLTMVEDANIQNWGTGRLIDGVDTAVLAGRLRILKKDSTWCQLQLKNEQTRRTRIDAEISGPGNMMCASANDGTMPCYELTGTNTSWSGCMVLMSDPTYPLKSPCLMIHDGRNLGGAMASYTVYGVWVRRNTCLWAKNTLAVTEPTRGVYVDGTNCLFRTDAGVTLAIDGAPLAINGQLVKEGAGTLALGGTLRFANDDKQLISPVAGKNLIHVKEGRLRALSAQGLAGATVSFAPGAAFAVALPTGGEEATFAQKGAVLTTSATPFDQTSAGVSATVPVTFDLAGDPPERTVTVPAFTVTAAVAANLSVTGVSPVRGYAVRISSAAADGQVTYSATLLRVGMQILFR